MKRSARELYEEAMRLDLEERAALAGLLIESLDPESEEGAEQAWVAEIERRMEELDSGAVQTIPWEELRARLYGSGRAPGRR
ncbi:MAG: addiction module protein [Armatimonadetes bacterium]|nr:addiction module protein [Armatimonadota bacterium]